MPCCAALSPLDGGHFSPCAKASAGRRQYNCQTLDLIFFGACMSVVSSGGSIALPGTIAPRNSPASQSADKTRGQVGGSRAISCSFDNMQQCIPGYRGLAGNELADLYIGQAVGAPSGRSNSLTSGPVSIANLQGVVRQRVGEKTWPGKTGRERVSPKGGWGWIDSDRCWCRNRERL